MLATKRENPAAWAPAGSGLLELAAFSPPPASTFPIFQPFELEPERAPAPVWPRLLDSASLRAAQAELASVLAREETCVGAEAAAAEKVHLGDFFLSDEPQVEQNQPVRWEIAAGIFVRNYHADGLGSIRALTDEAGVVTDTWQFEAFGEVVSHTGSDPNAYLFAGELLDPNVGWAYHRARWMDPSVGRFGSMDPFGGSIRDPSSLHRYSYSNENPTNRVDPTGLFSTSGEILAVAAMTMVISMSIGIRVGQTSLDYLPSDAFLSKPDGAFVGVQLSAGTGHYVRWLKRFLLNPIVVGISLGLIFTAATASLEFVFPFSSPGEVWVYLVGGAAFGPGVGVADSVGIYGGLIWSTRNSSDYSGSFYCISGGSTVSKYLKRPGTICSSSPREDGPGAYSAGITSSKVSGLFGVSSAYTYYYFLGSFRAEEALYSLLPRDLQGLSPWLSGLGS
jgi:RHS repeat-associated protein